jgi:hypothetical protein
LYSEVCNELLLARGRKKKAYTIATEHLSAKYDFTPLNAAFYKTEALL